MNNFRKLQALSSSEQVDLVKALLVLPVTAVALQLVGLRRWQLVMAQVTRAKAAKSKTGRSTQIVEAQRVARLVAIASRYGIHRANCLQQSLVLRWLLKQRNIESEIRYGARKEETELSAHAWVEFEGIVLNDTHDVGTRYRPFQHSLSDRSLPSPSPQDL